MRLRLIVGLGTLLGIVAAAAPCGAQQAVLLPSDVELASAYCIGVLQRQAAMADGRMLASPGANGYAAQQIEQHRQELRESLERLQSYLVPRMPYLDTMALASAGARADADIADRPRELRVQHQDAEEARVLVAHRIAALDGGTAAIMTARAGVGDLERQEVDVRAVIHPVP